MNYTRKRALLACDFCRRRKRRCDGRSPCSTCRDAQADCVYKELSTDRIEPSSSSQGAVVERLSRIEALLEEQGQRLSEVLPHSLGSTSGPFPSVYSSPRAPVFSPASWLEENDTGLETSFLVPSGHSATLHWLLSLPPIRTVVGVEFSQSYFYGLEEDTALPPPLDPLQPVPFDWPPLEPGRLQGLADAYFDKTWSHFPLLTRHYYQDLQENLFQHGPQPDLETAVCLSICALGCMASHSETGTDQHDELGLVYFAVSLKIIMAKVIMSFTPSLLLCQAFVLAALYFECLGRPLHAWKMIHYAGQQFLQIVNLRVKSGDVDYFDEDHIRVFWCCFVKECDGAAELDVERNGIEPLGDKMRLPRSADVSEAEDLIYFAADMAIRRLMNRIIGSLYSPDNIDIGLLAESASTPGNTDLNQLLALSSELNRQLEQYYATIPVQPPMTVDPTSNDKRQRLNLRSLYARHLIHRPFVLYVALQPAQQEASPSIHHASSFSRSPTPQPSQSSPYPMPSIILDKCYVCIQSCEAYILNVVDILGRRTPYLWTVSQSCLASFVVLYLASRSPHLRHMTPDLEALAGSFGPKLQQWATPGSSFEALLSVMNLLLASRHR